MGRLWGREVQLAIPIRNSSKVLTYKLVNCQADGVEMTNIWPIFFLLVGVSLFCKLTCTSEGARTSCLHGDGWIVRAGFLPHRRRNKL